VKGTYHKGRLAVASALVLLLVASAAFAAAPQRHRSYHSSRSHTYRPRTHRTYSARHSRRSYRVHTARPSSRNHGRIKRSESAKRDFMRQTGFPHGRHGYIIDHVVPLACGGADAPSNMQWQAAAEAKAKDKVERKGCK
jgi:hypothetical protein